MFTSWVSWVLILSATLVGTIVAVSKKPNPIRLWPLALGAGLGLAVAVASGIAKGLWVILGAAFGAMGGGRPAPLDSLFFLSPWLYLLGMWVGTVIAAITILAPEPKPRQSHGSMTMPTSTPFEPFPESDRRQEWMRAAIFLTIVVSALLLLLLWSTLG